MKERATGVMIWAFMRPARHMMTAAQPAAGHQTQPCRPAQTYRAAGGAGLGQQPPVPVRVSPHVAEPDPLAGQFDPTRLLAHNDHSPRITCCPRSPAAAT